MSGTTNARAAVDCSLGSPTLLPEYGEENSSYVLTSAGCPGALATRVEEVVVIIIRMVEGIFIPTTGTTPPDQT